MAYLRGQDVERDDVHIWQAVIALERFVSADDDYVIFRRFDKLQRYQLLYLQQQLSEYLSDILKEEGEKVPIAAKIGKLVTKASPLLKEYRDAVLAYHQMHGLPRTQKYVKSGVIKCGNRLLNSQHDPGNGWSELCSLAISQKGRIHRFLDDRMSSLRRILPEDFCKPLGDGRFRYEEAFLRTIDTVVVTILTSILLLAPISVLFLEESNQKVAVVLGCLIIAICLSSILTESMQQSRLTFTIAYGAFLVALVQPGN